MKNEESSSEIVILSEVKDLSTLRSEHRNGGQMKRVKMILHFSFFI